MARAVLKRGAVEAVWAGHPLVHARAIEAMEGAPAEGDAIDVVDPRGAYLGSGFYSPRSRIPIRIMSRTQGERLDGAAIARRLDAAARFRAERLGIPRTPREGYRLAHGEGDDLPGLVVDVFGSAAVVGIDSPGMERLRDEIVGHVARITQAKHILAAPTDGSEAFTEAALLRGVGFERFEFLDGGLEMELTGELMRSIDYTFDQRENRAKVARLAEGRRVLDAFSGVGPFGLGAARSGASHVVCLDRSSHAVAAGAACAVRHGLDARMEHRVGDTRRDLAAMARRGERYDLIVIDPPTFAPTRAHLDAALRAYRRVNTEALRMLSPGGVLVTCSRSVAIRGDEFQKMLAHAAAGASKRLHVFELGNQAPDYPHLAAFPEARYLDVVFARAEVNERERSR